MITASIEWPTGPVRLGWHPSQSVDVPITGSHGFIFGERGVLVVDVRSRGYTIPGGHIEAGETPASCLIREAREEASVAIERLTPLGYIVSDHSRNRAYDGPYPVRAAQSVFAASISGLHPFQPNDEILGRKEVAIEDLPRVHHEWNPVLGAAFEAAKLVMAADE